MDKINDYDKYSFCTYSIDEHKIDQDLFLVSISVNIGFWTAGMFYIID